MLASVLSYMSGRKLKSRVSENVFIPDYLGEGKPAAGASKSLEQQEAEMKAFADKLKAIQGKR